MNPGMRRRERGLSLVELMIASALGLVMLGAMGQALVNGSRSYREDEARARLDAEARFALAQLTADLEMAGWWGGLRGPQAVHVDASAAGLAGDCASALEAAVTPLGNATSAQVHERFPCISLAEFQGGDVIAVQRVAADPVPAKALLTGHAYLVTDGVRGILFRKASGVAPPVGEYYEYRPAIWYLRKYSASTAETPRVPALCRKVLSADATRMQSDSAGCLAQGIESLRLEPVRNVSGAVTAVQTRLSARSRELAARELRREGNALAVLRNAAWRSAPPALP